MYVYSKTECKFFNLSVDKIRATLSSKVRNMLKKFFVKETLDKAFEEVMSQIEFPSILDREDVAFIFYSNQFTEILLNPNPEFTGRNCTLDEFLPTYSGKSFPELEEILNSEALLFESRDIYKEALVIKSSSSHDVINEMERFLKKYIQEAIKGYFPENLTESFQKILNEHLFFSGDFLVYVVESRRLFSIQLNNNIVDIFDISEKISIKAIKKCFENVFPPLRLTQEILNRISISLHNMICFGIEYSQAEIDGMDFEYSKEREVFICSKIVKGIKFYLCKYGDCWISDPFAVKFGEIDWKNLEEDGELYRKATYRGFDIYEPFAYEIEEKDIYQLASSRTRNENSYNVVEPGETWTRYKHMNKDDLIEIMVEFYE